MDREMEKFKARMMQQAEDDIEELLQSAISSLLSRYALPVQRDHAHDVIKPALELAWLSGVQWGLNEGSERVAAMIPVVMQRTIDGLRETLREDVVGA